MTKTLYVISAAMLVSAGILAAICSSQWLRDTPHDPRAPEMCAVGKSPSGAGPGTEIDGGATPPLIKQAMAFALYLKPPEPPAPKPASRPLVAAQPAPRPAIVTPMFRLLSTSYHRSCPEKSLALVAEPGKGGYWVAQGDRLGHLVVESIKDGGIVWRDGNRLQEATVAVRDSPLLAHLKPKVSMAAHGPGSASPSSPRGAGMPGVQPVAGKRLD
jgi:hypothetical protein